MGLPNHPNYWSLSSLLEVSYCRIHLRAFFFYLRGFGDNVRAACLKHSLRRESKTFGTWCWWNWHNFDHVPVSSNWRGGSRDTPNYQSYWSFLMLNFISPVFYGKVQFVCIVFWGGFRAMGEVCVLCGEGRPTSNRFEEALLQRSNHHPQLRLQQIHHNHR